MIPHASSKIDSPLLGFGSDGGAGGAQTHDLTDYERTLRHRNLSLPATTVAPPTPPDAFDPSGCRDFAPRTAPRRSGPAGTVATGSSGSCAARGSMVRLPKVNPRQLAQLEQSPANGCLRDSGRRRPWRGSRSAAGLPRLACWADAGGREDGERGATANSAIRSPRRSSGPPSTPRV